jgi:hypothetical protein
MELNDSALEQAIRDLDTERVVEIVDADFGQRGEGIPDRAVDLLAGLLKREDVASLPESWTIVAVLDPEWQFLSRAQVGRLLAGLEEFFRRCDDDMGAFAVGAAIGEHDGSPEALEVLTRLALSEVEREKRRGALYGLVAMAERNRQFRPIVRSVLTRLVDGGDAAAASDAAEWLVELDGLS